jgi:hypothetical protein
MRPALVLSLSTAATIFFVAGCTFLISFDDVPDAGALAGDDDDVVDSGKKKTGSSSSSSSGESSSSSSGSTSSSSSSGSASSSSGTATVIPPPCDDAFDRNAINCATGSGNYTRPNCGSEPGLLQGAAQESDLIDCTGGGTPICVRHCPHGCAEMPAGHNDSCDECFDKADGWYCGKDLKGDWGPDDGMAVHCVGKKQVENAVCGAGKCATACPTPLDVNAARPSCCVP